MNESLTSQSQSKDSSQLVRDWFQRPTTSTASKVEADSLAVTIATFIQILRENRWLIIVLALLGAVLGVVKALSETPIYQASLTMAVEPSTSSNSSQALFDPYAYRFYETQYELLKSRSVAERVVGDLNLIEKESVTSLLVPPSLLKTLMIEIRRITGIEFGQTVGDVGDYEKLSDKEKDQKLRWLTNVIQSGVSVSGGEKTNLVTVTYLSLIHI